MHCWGSGCKHFYFINKVHFLPLSLTPAFSLTKANSQNVILVIFFTLVLSPQIFVCSSPPFGCDKLYQREYVPPSFVQTWDPVRVQQCPINRKQSRFPKRWLLDSNRDKQKKQLEQITSNEICFTWVPLIV